VIAEQQKIQFRRLEDLPPWPKAQELADLQASLTVPAVAAVRHALRLSHVFVSSAVYARLRADARARRWDETTDETITHSDGSSVVRARHRPPADLHDAACPDVLATVPVNGRPGHSGSAHQVADCGSLVGCDAQGHPKRVLGHCGLCKIQIITIHRTDSGILRRLATRRVR
jgi:hypothetical protein